MSLNWATVAAETYQNMKLAFEEDPIDERIIRWWFRKFNLEASKSILNKDKSKAKMEANPRSIQ